MAWVAGFAVFCLLCVCAAALGTDEGDSFDGYD